MFILLNITGAKRKKLKKNFYIKNIINFKFLHKKYNKG